MERRLLPGQNLKRQSAKPRYRSRRVEGGALHVAEAKPRASRFGAKFRNPPSKIPAKPKQRA